MTTIERSIEVDVPTRVAYDQWTQFEDFPHFMEGVEEVRQLDDTHLHWQAQIAGVRREWDAEIVDQQPDTCVSWRSLEGTRNAGTVTFAPLGADRTAVVLQLDVEPEGVTEKVGGALGIIERRAAGDLRRFKQFIESRGSETGAWRGVVADGQRRL